MTIVDASDLTTIKSPIAEAQAAVEKAQAVISKIERRRVACVQRGAELADERAAVALGACTGDSKAAKRLTEIHNAIAVHSSELAGFDAALKAAGEQLTAAEKTLAGEQSCAQACEQRTAFSRLVRAGVAADEALANLIEASHEIHEAMDEIHAAGSPAPTSAQVLTFGDRAIRSAVMNTMWARAVERLGPTERCTFAGIIREWETALGNRLGDAERDERAA
jgi:hypothetical protein